MPITRAIPGFHFLKQPFYLEEFPIHFDTPWFGYPLFGLNVVLLRLNVFHQFRYGSARF